MIEWFPYERAPLGRTRLRYVDLDAVLTDGKVERASKAPGFVLLFYGAEMEIIFVVGGEPVTAVRISDRERSVAPLAAVKRRASAEREWADVAYFQAPEPQLRAMYATVCGAPNFPTETLDATRPSHIFAMAREREYSGVLEFAEKNGKVHYLTFFEGVPMHAWFADQRRSSDRRDDDTLSTRIDRLFQPVRVEGMFATGYPEVEAMPDQAPPALCEVYAEMTAAALGSVSGATGPDVALRCFAEAFETLRERHPALQPFRLDEGARLQGDGIAPVADLTAGVAELLFEALSRAEQAGAPRAPAILEQVTRDNRFLLQANGFFDRFPWPVRV